MAACQTWTWGFYPLKSRLCLSQTLRNPESRQANLRPPHSLQPTWIVGPKPQTTARMTSTIIEKCKHLFSNFLADIFKGSVGPEGPKEEGGQPARAWRQGCLQLRLAARRLAKVAPSKPEGPVGGMGEVASASLRQAVRKHKLICTYLALFSKVLI